MKIAVVGASGKAGGLIANEAWSRGYEVTAVVRDAKRVDTDRYGVIVKELFALTEEDLEDFDVVVNAFGTAPGQEHQHQTAMTHFINIMENLPDTRFFVVGGAASLYTDETKTKQVITMIPEEYRAVPASMFIAFSELKKSKVNWTFLSPAFTFDPNGIRTGRYTLGTDYLIDNRRGESYVSYADYAVAMVDEMERGDYIGKRFTVVSDPGREQDPDELPHIRRAELD